MDWIDRNAGSSAPRRVPLDAHGQPPAGLYGERVQARLLAEMLGVVKGVIADGVVNDAEVVALKQWVDAHPGVTRGFPGNVLADRLVRIFDDGMVDDEERRDLREILHQMVGEPDDLTGTMDRAIRLGCEYPPPTILFEGAGFCFTGRFAYGTRRDCERAVTARAGRVEKDISRRVNYLIVGTYASDAWLHSTFGTKIEGAIASRDEGWPVRIVAEQHWVEALRYDEQ